MSTNSTTLVRESPWVREYSVDGERYLDSKYRTYDCEAPAAYAALPIALIGSGWSQSGPDDWRVRTAFRPPQKQPQP